MKSISFKSFINLKRKIISVKEFNVLRSDKKLISKIEFEQRSSQRYYKLVHFVMLLIILEISYVSMLLSLYWILLLIIYDRLILNFVSVFGIKNNSFNSVMFVNEEYNLK